MALPQPQHRLTESEYLALERTATLKSEFFNGEMFAMAGGSAMHSLIAANLIGHLTGKLKGGPCKVFTADLRLKVEATGLFTYADLSVVCGPLQFANNSNDTIINPTVVVEVLSHSTEAYDRGEKFQHYRQMPALKEYLLVSQRIARVEQFLRGPKAEWTLRIAEGIDATLALSSIQTTIELREVFAGVEFPPEPIRGQSRAG
jgi:Uma2 family endonuclease